MSLKFDRLVSLLRELFQLDQPDLDFGLYRIMHAKAAEVTQFLEEDLLPQVRKAFEQYQPADKAAVQKRLAEAIAAAESLGVDPSTNPKVAAIKAELAAAVDLSALEDEVFDHLHSFFRRYYSEGDFLSKRVYKPGVYAVPYEGEEVMLHWANKDQYYIKTSEYLRDYAFRLKPDSDTNPMRVHFRLAEVAEGEHGNIKAAEGKDRVFILAPAGDSGRDFIEIEKVNGQDELVIKFAYRPAAMEDWTEDAARSATEAAAKKPPTQKVLSDLAIKAILAVRDPALTPWISELAKPHIKVGGEQADYSRLQGHLSRYTARHTFDYFIHKDLGGFLRRELDFYIKNEVMHLDDIESESAPKVEQYLSKIKVIRALAGKITAFVAQLEDFQKKLWLKKKFVSEAFWCVRLGCVPHEFLPEIASNKEQHAEWLQTCRLDQLEPALGAPTYTSPLSIDYLKAQPTLVLDSRHFSADFCCRLLHAIGDLGQLVDVVAIHSDNFQGLSLLQSRYRGSVDAIYIDPPYNTDASPIVYKNGYRRSSWVSLMQSRLQIAQSLRRARSLQCIAIDDFEYPDLQELLEGFLGDVHHATAVVRSKPQGRPTATGFSANHEYATFWGDPAAAIGRLTRSGTKAARYPHRDQKGVYSWANFRKSGTDSDREDRKRSFYPMFVSSDSVRVPQIQWSDREEKWQVLEEPAAGEVAVWPIDPSNNEKVWTCSPERARDELADIRIERDESGRIELSKKYRPNQEGALPGTWWDDSRYSASESGTKVLKDLFAAKDFDYPKSVHLVADCLRVSSLPDSGTVLDYFAGSGTTGHAVINLNREDGGRRSCLLVETGPYFDTVLIPRLKKVTFAPEWKDGKPERQATSEEVDRAPRIVHVVRLESYEDALNNLLLKRSPEQESLLSRPESKALAEQYMLRYMLDTETRGSPSLLNIQRFTDPTAYKMRIKRPGTDESVVTAVDLIETFNWLIGLTVNHFAAPQNFTATFERDSEGRLRLKGTGARGGRLKPDADGRWWFRTVTGKAPDGKRVLVIWRKRPGGDTPEGIEQDNLVLDEWFRKQGYSTSDAEFDLIYVNGDNNLGNLRQEEADEKGLTETGWKVRVIEEDFHRLMFDTEGT